LQIVTAAQILNGKKPQVPFGFGARRNGAGTPALTDNPEH
jgi:hypothetical protein